MGGGSTPEPELKDWMIESKTARSKAAQASGHTGVPPGSAQSRVWREPERVWAERACPWPRKKQGTIHNPLPPLEGV